MGAKARSGAVRTQRIAPRASVTALSNAFATSLNESLVPPTINLPCQPTRRITSASTILEHKHHAIGVVQRRTSHQEAWPLAECGASYGDVPRRDAGCREDRFDRATRMGAPRNC